MRPVELEKRQIERNTYEQPQQGHALELIRKHGKDSLAYLTLEQGMKYFFGINCEGYIAYVLVGKVAVCLGNPVCPLSDINKLLKEFRGFCLENKFKICFCSITDTILPVFEKEGFCVSKYGEEAVLDLDAYKTVGSSTLKLRQKVRRAEKLGISTIEYKPAVFRDFVLEKKIADVSEQWFEGKNYRLKFTLGDMNLANPIDRRYFVSLDENENVYAILVFSPFDGGKGFFLDVMRRSNDAVPGVMEKAIIDAAMIMKDEGVEWVSLGVAPLAGIANQGRMNMLEKYFHFTFNNFNQKYGFKTLYEYKKKFSPSRWVVRYVAHEPSLSYLRVAYAMAKSRNAEKLWNHFVLGLLIAGKFSVEKAKNHFYQRYLSAINIKTEQLLMFILWSEQFLSG